MPHQAFYRVFLHLSGYAWVTLATNDAYSLGALVLAHSLRRVGTKHELACLVTPGVTATMRYRRSPSSIRQLPDGNTLISCQVVSWKLKQTSHICNIYIFSTFDCYYNKKLIFYKNYLSRFYKNYLSLVREISFFFSYLFNFIVINVY